MTSNGWLQILFFLALILLVTKPMGVFMTHVFNREHTFLDPVLRPIERLIYKLTRVNAEREMRWTEYAVAMLLFSVVSMLVLYLIQRLQGVLPFNPQQLAWRRLRRVYRFVIQHRRIVYHQYQLAVLRAGSDDELLHADGRAWLITTSSPRPSAFRWPSLSFAALRDARCRPSAISGLT